MKAVLFFIVLLCSSVTSFAQDNMSQESMENIVKEMSPDHKGRQGAIQFIYNNVQMYLISDVKYNRMRIIAPIIEYKKLERKHIDKVLESNFHGSLDARYAVSNGLLYSAFIHPLSELGEPELKSAVVQVSNLALSFGSEYSSGLLKYGGRVGGLKKR